jgi:hypothetical protein
MGGGELGEALWVCGSDGGVVVIGKEVWRYVRMYVYI